MTQQVLVVHCVAKENWTKINKFIKHKAKSLTFNSCFHNNVKVNFLSDFALTNSKLSNGVLLARLACPFRVYIFHWLPITYTRTSHPGINDLFHKETDTVFLA